MSQHTAPNNRLCVFWQVAALLATSAVFIVSFRDALFRPRDPPRQPTPFGFTLNTNPHIPTRCLCCELHSGVTSRNSTVTLWADPPVLHITIVAKDDAGQEVGTGDDIFFVSIRTSEIVTRMVATDHKNGTHTCSYALTGNPTTFKVGVMLAFRVSNRHCNSTTEEEHAKYPRGGDATFPHWTDSDRLFTDTITWAKHFDDPHQALSGSPYSLSPEDIAKNWSFEPSKDARLFTGAFVHLDACLKHQRCLGSSNYSVMLSVADNGNAFASLQDIWIWVPPSSYFYLFTEQQVADCLNNKHVVFAGDSLIHSLFVELDSMVGFAGCDPFCKWCFGMPCKHPQTTVRLSYEETLPRTADSFFQGLFETELGKIYKKKLETADHVVMGFGLWDMLENGYANYNKNQIPRYEAVRTYRGNVTKLMEMANQTRWQWVLTTAMPEREHDKIRVDLAIEYNKQAQSVASKFNISVFDYFHPTLALVEFPQWWADHVHWIGHRAASEFPRFRGGVMAGHQFIHHYLATMCPHDLES